MVGGTIIENTIVDGKRRLWCVDRRSADECAVMADIDEAADVRAGDSVWWQAGKIYWTRYENPEDDEPVFCERELRKLGYSFDPRRDNRN